MLRTIAETGGRTVFLKAGGAVVVKSVNLSGSPPKDAAGCWSSSHR